MKSWPTKKLGEVLELCDSGTWGTELPKGMPLLRSTNMQNGNLILDDLKYIDVPSDKKERYTLKEGDILITKSSGSVDHIGKSLYITKEMDGKYGFSNFTQRLRVDKRKVIPKWIYLKISNPTTRSFLLSASQTTTGLRNLKIPALKELEIPLPTIGEQRKIVGRIEKLFAKIDEASLLRAESLTASATLLPSALHQIFSTQKHPYKLENVGMLQPKQKVWEEKKIGEILEFKYGKGIPRHDRKEDGKYPIYGANGELGRTDKFLVEGEALIIGRKGSAGEVTRVSGKFWPSDVTYYVLGNNHINVDYLFYVLKKVDLRQLAVGVKPGINRNRAYEIKISLPPIAEQKKIVAYLDSLSAKARALQLLQQETKNDLSTLRQSILSQAFSGKL
ncbi:restriction endonuclease subunit S [Patescibacteria group bacterium]|nr:restriction endonuclease subunit S [Patescibacteria group bacterium]MBU4000068.1 restriction endonuclease subunit S [Patescibacteria group bacterium]MBU4056285.1 restriction endonuclease subunit S [Patescibacteria group bacterium]MBU4369111.1 restriction endonuclease subunit S [Patescibacteria group bacterium]